MSPKRAQSLTHLCLGLICLAGLMNVGILSWGETLRLLVIQVGLAVLFLRYRRTLAAERRAEVERGGAVILALCTGFVVTQFDPATASIGYRTTPDRANPFFYLSTGLLATAALAVVPAYGESLRWKQLSLLDRVVLGVITGVGSLSLLMLGSTRSGSILGTVKLLSYACAWIAVTRAYSDPVWRPVQEEQTGAFRYVSWLMDRWRGNLVVMTVLFVPAIWSGVSRTLSVVYSLNEAQKHFVAGEWEQARIAYGKVQDLNRAVGLDYAESGTLRDLAVIELRTGRSDAARGYLRAVGSGLGRGSAAVRRGDVYFEAEQWGSAAASYELALSELGHDPDVLTKLGRTYLQMRDTQGYLQLYRRYRHFPDPVPATFDELIFLGNVHYYRGDYKAARRYYQKASDMRPQNAYAVYRIGRALLAGDDIQDALRPFERAIELEPDFADAYYRLGECYEQMGDADRAMDLYRKAVELLPNHLDAKMKLQGVRGG